LGLRTDHPLHRTFVSSTGKNENASGEGIRKRAPLAAGASKAALDGAITTLAEICKNASKYEKGGLAGVVIYQSPGRKSKGSLRALPLHTSGKGITQSAYNT